MKEFKNKKVTVKTAFLILFIVWQLTTLILNYL